MEIPIIVLPPINRVLLLKNLTTMPAKIAPTKLETPINEVYCKEVNDELAPDFAISWKIYVAKVIMKVTPAIIKERTMNMTIQVALK